MVETLVSVQETVQQTVDLTRELLDDLKFLCRLVRSREEELEAFVSAYYQQVAESFNQGATTKARPQMQHSGFHNRTAQSDVLEQETRTLYCHLAKTYHPDASLNGDLAASRMQLASEAYKKRQIWKLYAMEIERLLALPMIPNVRQTRLKKLHDTIAHAITQWQLRRQEIENSMAWQLKTRLEANPDLLAQIKARMAEAVG